MHSIDEVEVGVEVPQATLSRGAPHPTGPIRKNWAGPLPTARGFAALEGGIRKITVKS